MGMLSRAMRKIAETTTDENFEVHTNLRMPVRMVRDLEVLASDRGISVDKLVQIHLDKLLAQAQGGREKLYNLQDVLDFGQYKGYRVEDIVRGDPRYMAWLSGTSEWFTLSAEAENLLEDYI